MRGTDFFINFAKILSWDWERALNPELIHIYNQHTNQR